MSEHQHQMMMLEMQKQQQLHLQAQHHQPGFPSIHSAPDFGATVPRMPLNQPAVTPGTRKRSKSSRKTPVTTPTMPQPGLPGNSIGPPPGMTNPTGSTLPVAGPAGLGGMPVGLATRMNAAGQPIPGNYMAQVSCD